MNEVQTIAKLVANLGFTIEDGQLNTFLLKLSQTVEILRQFKTEALTGIKFTVSVDKSALTTTKAEIKTLASLPVKFSDVSIAEHSLRSMRVQVNTALADSVVRIAGIKPINATDLKTIQKQVTDSLKTSPVIVPAGVSTKKLNADLKAWGKTVRDTFNYKLKLGVSQQHLTQSLREAVNFAGAQVSTIKLKDPKVKVGIDKQHLTTEIREALAQIRKEVKIKIDLTGHGNISGGGGANRGGRAPQGGFGARHGAMAGGIAGAAAGWGRGFIPGLGGAFAISQLNRQVQEFESQQQAAAAVSGSQEKGTAALERLRAMGNEVGFNYRSQAMPFLRMISSGTNAGMQQGEVETIFGNMAKYGRVMGLDDESMKGSMRAVEQMLNKQQVYS